MSSARKLLGVSFVLLGLLIGGCAEQGAQSPASPIVVKSLMYFKQVCVEVLPFGPVELLVQDLILFVNLQIVQASFGTGM